MDLPLSRKSAASVVAKLPVWVAMPAVLGLLVVIVFFPLVRIPFLADDYILLELASQDHADLSILAPIPEWIFFRPLARMIWLAAYSLWQDNVIGYHLISFGLHWLNSLLVFAVVRRLVPKPAAIAPGAAVLFVLLPLHVEAVAWLSCQHDLLVTAGYLLTILCLLYAWRDGRKSLYLLSIVTFQLSLWAKEPAFSLPLMVLVLGLILRDRPTVRVIVGSAVPYALLVGINLAQRYGAWGSIRGYPGASYDYASFAADKLVNVLLTFLAPLNRMLIPTSVVQLWMLAVMALLALGLLTTHDRRTVLLSLAWVLVTLLPAFNLIGVGSDLQDSRHLYLPSVGFALGSMVLLWAIVQRLVSRRRSLIAFVAVALICVPYTWAARTHVQAWVIAGRELTHVLEQLHQIKPQWAPSDSLQIAGLADHYMGAYTVRNGLSRAFFLNYGSTFGKWEIVKQLPKIPYEQAQGDIVQVTMSFDPAGARWDIQQARAVSAANPAPPLSVDEYKSWNFADCQLAFEWAPPDARNQCRQEIGLAIVPADGLPALTSPVLNLSGARWFEIVFTMSTIDQTHAGSTARLQWTTGSAASWAADREQSIELSTDSASRRYHFFLPAGAPNQRIKQLRLYIDHAQGSVAVKSVAIRSVR